MAFSVRCFYKVADSTVLFYSTVCSFESRNHCPHCQARQRKGFCTSSKRPFIYYVSTFLGFLDFSMFYVLRISKNYHFLTPPTSTYVIYEWSQSIIPHYHVRTPPWGQSYNFFKTSLTNVTRTIRSQKGTRTECNKS